MKVMNKKGQFFLLAAVIIASVVISLGAIKSSVIVSSGGESLDDLVEEVMGESRNVIEYEIASGGAFLSSVAPFANEMSDFVSGREPYANFLFVFGNSNTLMILEYEPQEVVDISPSEFFDVKTNNSGVLTDLPAPILEDGGKKIYRVSLAGMSSVHVFIDGVEYHVYPISISREFDMIIQKEVRNERFIAVG